MGTMGGKTHSWIASTTFSRARFWNASLLDLCEHNRYEVYGYCSSKRDSERINQSSYGYLLLLS